MRLPASIIAQPPDATDTQPLAVTHIDPTDVSDAEPTTERMPWWMRVSGAIVNSAFTNVAAVLIAVMGAVYVGMYHAPWVRSLASRIPTAVQAGDAMGVAVAAASVGAATPATPADVQPPSSDHVTAARDRMERRVYAQVPGRARTVAENEAMSRSAPALDSEGSATESARHHHRGTRHVRRTSPWNAQWYKGA